MGPLISRVRKCVHCLIRVCRNKYYIIICPTALAQLMDVQSRETVFYETLSQIQ